MTSPGIYLDHAATTPVAPQVLEAMLPFLGDGYGNPSSVHAAGRSARNAVDDARDALASVIGASHREVVFTGSGSEADNLAIRGVLERQGPERGRHLVVSAIEHDAVLETARRLQELGAAEVTTVPCGADGAVDPERVAGAVRDDTLLVSVMLVNNETGVLQDVPNIVEAVHVRNPRTLVHTDAVQAMARVSVDVASLGVDLLSLSAHKFYGPKGVGALWVRHGVLLGAQITGGGHERNRRSGTENVAGIAGLAAAAQLVERERGVENDRQKVLSERLTSVVCGSVPGTTITGDPSRRVAGFATFAFEGARSDLLLTTLDGLGVYGSGGSACASGAPTPSHVLVAMGLDDALAAGALRLTTGRGTSEEDIDTAGRAIATAVAQVRGATPALRDSR
ncbi:MAG TPA: cysteine desulfurase family protein [Candidatus Dormibacteraeota bacterium]|nr:cysteine desulfurase family protein [Candidatus Dormibacteraeota bacterium]